MAETKAKAAVKAVAEKGAAVKEVAKEEVKAIAEKAVKKAPAKAAAKKTAAKKTTAKKTAAKKAPAKKAEIKSTVTYQISDKSYTTEDLVKISKDVWKYDLGKKPTDLKTVELYVKPEEPHVVYYVMNGENTGSFAI